METEEADFPIAMREQVLYNRFKLFIIVADMGRSVIALFMVGFLAIFSAFWTGVVGCWRRSPGNITATAILMLFACQF